jgi:hypothetical protein
MLDIDETKRRRRGRLNLDPSENRTHTISTRLNDVELAELDQKCAQCNMQRGEFLRTAALHKLPEQIPQINREQWIELSRTAANLNQLAHHLNATEIAPAISEVRAVLSEFRDSLLGMKS